MKKYIYRIYDELCKCLSTKNITIVLCVFFIITLLPILYCGFVNRATGDDYFNAVLTRMAWVNTESIVEVLKAACQWVKDAYQIQGTWSSLFLFSLHPEVFSEKAYFLVTIAMVLLWCGSSWYLLREVLINKLKLDISSSLLVWTINMLINMQFIPSVRASLYWHTGCSHYMIPFSLCQIGVVFLLKFLEKYKVRYYIYLCFIMIYMGGSSYQTALYIILLVVGISIYEYMVNKNRKAVWLVIPCMLEVIGLIVSILSPGNKVRGGEEFGFSFKKIVETIGLCFVKGIEDIHGYLQNKTIIFIMFIALYVIMLETIHKRGNDRVKLPVIFLVYYTGVYFAMQAPAIYAGVEVSGGVYNINYLSFTMLVLVVIYIVAEKTMYLFCKISNEKLHNYVVVPTFCICCILLLMVKEDIKKSTEWVCLEYIISGQAKSYKEQMELQTELLMNSVEEEVVLPMINDFQGPLMHMPIVENANNYTNVVTAKFYGKKRVIGIERTEWLKIYVEGNQSVIKQ